MLSALPRPILSGVAILQLFMAFAAVPGEVDRFCRKGFRADPRTGRVEDVCTILAVDRGNVTYIEPGFRQLVIGKYVPAAQAFVPPTEAPIRLLQSPHGWHIVVSSFLKRGEESGAALHVTFLDPNRKLHGTDEALMTLEASEVGNFFGGADDILAIQSNEEHSYNSMTNIWLLPARGDPQQLIDLNATIGRFSKGGRRNRPGVWIRRQTYDGGHAETKGWLDEFWVWDAAKKSLTFEKE